jgi:hypothetical protein
MAASGEPVHFDFVVGDAVGGAASVARGTDGDGLFFQFVFGLRELGIAAREHCSFFRAPRACESSERGRWEALRAGGGAWTLRRLERQGRAKGRASKAFFFPALPGWARLCRPYGAGVGDALRCGGASRERTCQGVGGGRRFARAGVLGLNEGSRETVARAVERRKAIFWCA